MTDEARAQGYPVRIAAEKYGCSQSQMYRLIRRGIVRAIPQAPGSPRLVVTLGAIEDARALCAPRADETMQDAGDVIAAELTRRGLK